MFLLSTVLKNVQTIIDKAIDAFVTLVKCVIGCFKIVAFFDVWRSILGKKKKKSVKGLWIFDSISISPAQLIPWRNSNNGIAVQASSFEHHQIASHQLPFLCHYEHQLAFIRSIKHQFAFKFASLGVKQSGATVCRRKQHVALIRKWNQLKKNKRENWRCQMN